MSPDRSAARRNERHPFVHRPLLRPVVGAALLLSAWISAACASSGIEGRWTAEARMPGAAMTLILDVGAAGARISVPAERVLGMGVTEFEFEPPALAFRIPHPD